ncbi:MAG: 30S ribosomal protein S8 [Zetaproteobacteria bacterium]|nr:30S ribosomal protein S8 [Pseudobdellovibrionaceae bacterium]|tara:strand:+ start:44 stop:442 length:399 start_codon:yes stop_codon:yes gene_type:complete
MNITDPIADLLTRIRNAQKARIDVVSVPASKMKIAIAHILREEGFIVNYKCIRDNKQGILKIALRYSESGVGVIREIQRRSKSSLRSYVSADAIPYVKNGFGIGIVSTSKGVMTDREARKQHIGGEYLCSVF